MHFDARLQGANLTILTLLTFADQKENVISLKENISLIGKDPNVCSCSLISNQIVLPHIDRKKALVSPEQFIMAPNISLSRIDQICRTIPNLKNHKRLSTYEKLPNGVG